MQQMMSIKYASMEQPRLSMKDTKLINTMEKSGYKGIKKWMEQCENDTGRNQSKSRK